mmetsp:Transcript_103804/g.317909  ORF Transcript_103804/g.317909 Transcript_103804/m.317909 type:complete len:303 (+) Transcript_103804:123-1031(+)
MLEAAICGDGERKRPRRNRADSMPWPVQVRHDVRRHLVPIRDHLLLPASLADHVVEDFVHESVDLVVGRVCLVHLGRPPVPAQEGHARADDAHAAADAQRERQEPRGQAPHVGGGVLARPGVQHRVRGRVRPRRQGADDEVVHQLGVAVGRCVHHRVEADGVRRVQVGALVEQEDRRALLVVVASVVQGAEADDVLDVNAGTALNQQTRCVHLAVVAGREVEGRPPVPILRLDLRADVEEASDHLGSAHPGGVVQRRPDRVVLELDVRVRVEQQVHEPLVPRDSSAMKGYPAGLVRHEEGAR